MCCMPAGQAPGGPGASAYLHLRAGGVGQPPMMLRCQAFYHTGRPILALEEARRALALSPEDRRLRENVELLERQMRHTEASTPY